MKKNKIKRFPFLLVFTVCIVSAFAFLMAITNSNITNLIATDPNTEFNITYDLKDGKFEENITAPTKYKYIEETSIPNPVKDGSEFLGWTINDKEGEPVKDYKIPKGTTGDIKLTANWKVLQVKLMDGKTFKSTIKGMSGFANVTEIKFIKGTPNPNGVNVTVEGEAKAYIEGNVLTVASEREIFANPNSSYMFSDFENITNIEFNNFNTSQVTDMRSMFSQCNSLKSLNLSNFNTSQVTDMRSMFYYCSSLTSIDLSSFNTSKITDMYFMFTSCYLLTSLDLSNFDTSQVTSMYGMFSQCNSLTSLNLSNFDTSNVTDTSYMFYNCKKLDSSITIKNPNVTSYTDMFKNCSTDPSAKFVVNYTSGCKSVAEKMVATKGSGNVVLGGMPSTLMNGQTFNSTIKGMSGFENVTEIRFEQKSGTLSGTDISEAKDGSIKARISGNILYVEANGEIFANSDCSSMFSVCYKLTSIDVSNFDTSQVTNMRSMFSNCSSLTSLDVSNFDTSQVTNINSMFFNCSSLTSLNLSNFDTSQVTNMHSMFYTCKSLTNLNLSNFNTSNVTDMSYMFNYCEKLTSLNLSNFNTSQVTNMRSMFYTCKSLTNLNLSNFNTSNVTDMSYMFNYCEKLSGSITIMNPNITKYANMFQNCSTEPSAKFIVKYVDEETKKVATDMVATKSTNSNVFLYEPPATLMAGEQFRTTLEGMNGFENVTEIRFIKGTPNPNGTNVAIDGIAKAYIDGNVLTVASEGEIFANKNCGNMFKDLSNLTNIDLSNFNTSKVTSMNHMFYWCDSLTSLDVSSFDTSNVTDMNNMFICCSSLTSLDLSNFNTSKVTNMSRMFSNCSSLTSLDVSSFDTSNVTDMNNMFSDCSSLTSLDLSKWDTSQVTIMYNMFYGCKSLTSIKGLENFDTHRVDNMYRTFKDCGRLCGEITIMNPNLNSYYSYTFANCSTDSSAKFVVNYIDEATKKVATDMVATKSTNSNVVLGTRKSLLSEDITNKEEPSVPDTIVLTIKDGNTTTTKEIVTGEIGSLNTPSKEGMVFSGYFYDAEYTKPVSERDVISEDTTIYIKWEEAPQEETPQVEETPQEENKDESLGEVA